MNILPEDLSDALDFPEVLQEVRGFCSTPIGGQRILGSAAYSDHALLLQVLRETDSCLQLLLQEISIPALSFELNDQTLALLKTKNACLDSDQFFELRSLALTYSNVCRFLKENRERAPLLWNLIEHDPELPQIIRSIDKVFDESRIVRSSASKDLSRIRSEIQRKRQSADRIFQRIQQRMAGKGLLGDIGESVHDNRRVLAIQAAYKGQVNGIFHGSSNKHSLYYLEPAECIGINNELALLFDEERKEIRRILITLTSELSVYRPQLVRFRDILIHLDTLRAKAIYAHRYGACLPQINKDNKLELIDAFNPVLLIHNRKRKKDTIPCSLSLDEDNRILVISGPNAGGKSITLKTVGLLQLMLQSGFLIPVKPNSQCYFVERLMGDIGDSQSIENELSTYSSRLEKMRIFLLESDENGLLLIDEFGSGSDPDLGSALAEEVLERLHNLGVRSVITTHYNRIKSLASNLPAAFNGNMAFDQRSFRPEYRLQTGTPGSSYTFEVAHRAGLDDKLIQKAKQRLDEDKVRLDGLLSGVQREKQTLSRQRKRMSKELEDLRQLKEEQGKKIEKLEDKQKRQSQVNEEQSRQLMWGKRFARFVEEWGKAKSKRAKKEVTDRIVSVLTEQDSSAKKLSEKEAQREKRREEARMKRLLAIPINEGDEVRMLGTRQKGRVLSVKGTRFQVQFGNMVSSLDRDKIIKTETEREMRQKEQKKSGVQSPSTPKKKR